MDLMQTVQQLQSTPAGSPSAGAGLLRPLQVVESTSTNGPPPVFNNTTTAGPPPLKPLPAVDVTGAQAGPPPLRSSPAVDVTSAQAGPPPLRSSPAVDVTSAQAGSPPFKPLQELDGKEGTTNNATSMSNNTTTAGPPPFKPGFANNKSTTPGAQNGRVSTLLKEFDDQESASWFGEEFLERPSAQRLMSPKSRKAVLEQEECPKGGDHEELIDV